MQKWAAWCKERRGNREKKLLSSTFHHHLISQFGLTTCTKLNTKIKKLLSNFGLQNYKTYKNSISTLKGIWFHCGCHINRSLVDIWRPTDNKCIGFQQVILFNFSTIVDFPINWSSGGIFSFQIDMNVIECEFKKNCHSHWILHRFKIFALLCNSRAIFFYTWPWHFWMGILL